VPHLLTDDLKEKRKAIATLMLPYLEAARNDGWKHFVTGDESWFFLTTGPRRMWALSKDDVATKPRTEIQSKKFMFTIMWNPSGFYVIDRLPSGAKLNAFYYTTNILTPLQHCFFPKGRKPHGKRLVVHVDNCSVHRSRITELFMESHDMISMPHPPYSPDLAPSDFYLFGAVKQQLEHITVTDDDQFFEELHSILESISREELRRVFDEWLQRIDIISQGDGSYIW
jgi:hypothetical protein